MLKGRNPKSKRKLILGRISKQGYRVFVTLQCLEIRRWTSRACYVLLQRECYSCSDVTSCFGGEFASYIEPMWNLALIARNCSLRADNEPARRLEELKLESEFVLVSVLSTDFEHICASL